MLPVLDLGPSDDDPRPLQEADFLVRAGVWPRMDRFNARGWIDNFVEAERPYAYDLLRSFMYFSPALSEELLRSAVQRVWPEVVDVSVSAAEAEDAWRTFVDGVVVVPVGGEGNPNPTDSGYTYVRAARNAFGLDEDQFQYEDQARGTVWRRLENGGTVDVLFLDDFVGTGEQFVETWERESVVGSGLVSFASLAARGGRYFFCPLVTADMGAGWVRERCSGLVLSPAHFLPPEYSAFHSESRVWAEERRATGPAVLEGIAERAGMPATGTDSWRGYKSLGLTVAFHDSIPDASLGVYRWAGGDWAPLFRTRAGT